MNISIKYKRTIIITYIFLCALIIVFGIFSRQNGNTFSQGYLFFMPARYETAPNTLTISGSVYAKEGIEKAHNDYKQTIPIEFEQVEYKGEVLEILSTFKIDMELSDGIYTAQISALTKSDREHLPNTR